jgi:predicted nucleic acid-binding protein
MMTCRRALPFTPWHRLEVRNAIRIAEFYKKVTRVEARSQLLQLDTDLREEVILSHVPIEWADTLRRAEGLSRDHNVLIGCSSADLFHVAAALELRCDTFYTFDARQEKLATAAGLKPLT